MPVSGDVFCGMARMAGCSDSNVNVANAAFRDIFVRVLIDDWSGSYLVALRVS